MQVNTHTNEINILSTSLLEEIIPSYYFLLISTSKHSKTVTGARLTFWNKTRHDKQPPFISCGGSPHCLSHGGSSCPSSCLQMLVSEIFCCVICLSHKCMAMAFKLWSNDYRIWPLRNKVLEDATFFYDVIGWDFWNFLFYFISLPFIKRKGKWPHPIIKL